jgi:hypothetical protein
MPAAALNEYIATACTDSLTIVELKLDLARQNDSEVDSISLVMRNGEGRQGLATVHKYAAARESTPPEGPDILTATPLHWRLRERGPPEILSRQSRKIGGFACDVTFDRRSASTTVTTRRVSS